MQSDGLRLRIWRDASDGTCELEAMARSRGFSGIGSAWFGVAQVVSFAEALAEFPIAESAKRGISGGYFGSRGLEQVPPGAFRQTDRLGWTRCGSGSRCNSSRKDRASGIAAPRPPRGANYLRGSETILRAATVSSRRAQR